MRRAVASRKCGIPYVARLFDLACDFPRTNLYPSIPGTQPLQTVLAAVDELGYRPNRAAQGLRTRRTATIGFITDEVAVESSVGQIIAGAHDVAWGGGSVLLVINTMRSRTVTRAALDTLADRQVDSVIYASAGTGGSLCRPLPAGFPPSS